MPASRGGAQRTSRMILISCTARTGASPDNVVGIRASRYTRKSRSPRCGRRFCRTPPIKLTRLLAVSGENEQRCRFRARPHRLHSENPRDRAWRTTSHNRAPHDGSAGRRRRRTRLVRVRYRSASVKEGSFDVASHDPSRAAGGARRRQGGRADHERDHGHGQREPSPTSQGVLPGVTVTLSGPR